MHTHATIDAAPASTEFFRAAGRLAASRLPVAQENRTSPRTLRQRTTLLRAELRAAMLRDTDPATHRWLVENARLIASAEREAREFVWTSREAPAVVTAGEVRPRVSVLVEAYLGAAAGQFVEDEFIAFLQGVQETHDLLLGELWASRPALMLALLERVIAAAADADPMLPDLVTSIRHTGETNWTELFLSVSVVDRVLAGDPAQAYTAMDKDSRDAYRHVVSYLARHSTRSERQVAEAAVALASAARGMTHADDVAAARRAHVGYYLVDDGLGALEALIHFRAPLSHRLRDAMTAHPTVTYLGGVALVTVAIVVAMLNGIDMPTTAVVAFLLLLLPATQAAVELINALVPALVRPRALPKLDFSEGIPADCTTLVAVPTLLLSEPHVHELVMDLEIRYLANRDPQLHFALLTDSVDAEDEHNAHSDPLVPLAESLIHRLNERYGTPQHTPFYLFHRHRVYNASEQRWMGWERKRGKLLDLNKLLRGAYDAFPVKVGHLATLPQVRYVITLDSDTQLPRDSAQRLVGTLAHPLNRAVVDPATRRVVEGYGILQPRIGISTQSASKSWLASLLSGQTGFDIYTRAFSDAYQDLFGEGSFTGKGIYDVDAFRVTLERRFPENTLLSHDLIEGIFARAALVSDIELIDDYPTHFSAYTRRKHRWMRGDWQILRWLMPKVPDDQRRLIPNDISAISRWKILDNLRRSLFEPATLLLLLAGWLVFPQSAALWTVLTVAMLLLPAYASLLVSFTRAPWGRSGFGAWARDTASTFGRQHLMALLNFTYLLHDALLAMDAIVRSLARVFVTRQRMLEWETAAEAREAAGPRRAADMYLDALPVVAAALLLVLGLVRGPAFLVAVPVIMLWIIAGPLATWLGRPPRTGPAHLAPEDETWVRQHGVRMWRFFREHGTAERNGLIPDHVTEDGLVAERISPTNLGFLLNARIAAVHMGYLTLPEFVRETTRTLDGAARLPHARGHVLNWCTTDTCAPLDPMFVSTVDSGNLAACLWTLKQSALAFAREAPDPERLWSGIRDVARIVGTAEHAEARGLAERIVRTDADWRAALPQLETLARHVEAELGAACEATPDEPERQRTFAGDDIGWWMRELVERLVQTRLWLETGPDPALRHELETIAARADRLVAEMDFAFLYNPRKKTLSIGYDSGAGKMEPATYDLLASEARIAAFVAIAKGDAPQESWFHLGRTHVVTGGERVLSSWTGTMFEYLMPALWMRHYQRTIMPDSMRAMVRLQQAFTRRRGVPWGISESGHVGAEAAGYGYAAFGLPQVALKRLDAQPLVVSPYSSFLALLVEPRAAVRNLRHIERLGWHGRYGMYEAADYASGDAVLVRSWMAHHLGMSLLAVCNLVCDHVLQRDFHAEPQVLATELLLHERVPPRVVSEAEEWLVQPVAP
jgi:cyclic beta-1,2-glucan synthetase